jgi:hypothetical protein
MFGHVIFHLNLELDLGYGSGICPNLEPDLGQVQKGLGLNLGSEPNRGSTRCSRQPSHKMIFIDPLLLSSLKPLIAYHG